MIIFYLLLHGLDTHHVDMGGSMHSNYSQDLIDIEAKYVWRGEYALALVICSIALLIKGCFSGNLSEQKLP